MSIFMFSLISLIVLIFLRGIMVDIDYSINLWSSSIHQPTLTIIAIFISIIFDANSMIMLSILFCIILYIKGYYKPVELMIFSGSMIGNTITTYLIKELVKSPRPLNMIISESGYSFPSGHSSSTTIFTILSSYMLLKRGVVKNKYFLYLLSTFLTFIVCLDRVYLNVHWLSDVLGGVFLGSSWGFLAIIIFECIYFEAKLT